MDLDGAGQRERQGGREDRAGRREAEATDGDAGRPIRRTCPSSMPQPIWYPASSVPPLSVVLPLPVTVPVNVPPTRYSREETAVVSGATGSWVSLLATTVSVQPSGLVTTPGSADATTPLSGGGPTSPAGSIGGIRQREGRGGGEGKCHASGCHCGEAIHCVLSFEVGWG